MNTKTLPALLLSLTLLVGCASPATLPPPTASFVAFPTSTLVNSTLPAGAQTPGAATLSPGVVTPLPGGTVTTPQNPATICGDPQVTALIDSFKTAILTSDGPLLSALVSPSRGMDVAYFRDGTVITYQPEHAKFLFETTFEVDWGAEPGSGAMKQGSFHDVVLPELVRIFNQPYTLHCNELKHGGATYEMVWEYQSEFYSIYFPGTPENGNMDWHTWVIGIEYVSGKPYVYALIQFFWEP
ncbi:MAG TPA: hypothetical protein VJ821_15010 [Anaerolineales bacterium]|nr:hypothetical protein [Anaerolineales bacterium]